MANVKKQRAAFGFCGCCSLCLKKSKTDSKQMRIDNKELKPMIEMADNESQDANNESAAF